MRAGTRTVPADTVRELGAALAPGCAIAAVLVEHVWAGVLEEAVSRTGGKALSFVAVTQLGELAPALVKAAHGTDA